jgi:LacI family transcriptional regulator
MMSGKKIASRRVLLPPMGIATRQSTDVVAVSDPKIAKVVRFIRENACEGITVEDALKAVPMSRTLLERRFSTLLGRTPHEHILQVKLDRAKMMLTSTDLPIALISERTGFEHNEYFCVVFKRVCGETPRQFRDRNKT